MLMQHILNIRHRLADLIYPAYCIGCGKMGSYICSVCYIGLNNITIPPFDLSANNERLMTINGSIYSADSSIDGIYSPFRFESLIRECIHRFKYRNFRALAAPLSQLLCRYLQFVHFDVDLIVPVPLHVRRLRQRGYNQSQLLTNELVRSLNIPVDAKALVRHIDTLPQTITASSAQRKKNVVNAFRCTVDSVRGKKVLLIDDVCTTGATLNACAAALKKAGSFRVWGLTLAREI